MANVCRLFRTLKTSHTHPSRLQYYDAPTTFKASELTTIANPSWVSTTREGLVAHLVVARFSESARK